MIGDFNLRINNRRAKKRKKEKHFYEILHRLIFY